MKPTQIKQMKPQFLLYQKQLILLMHPKADTPLVIQLDITKCDAIATILSLAYVINTDINQTVTNVLSKQVSIYASNNYITR